MTLYSANIIDLAKPVEGSLDKKALAKQKAAETRKRKREEKLDQQKTLDNDIQAKQTELIDKQKELIEKKKQIAEKRRLKRLEKKNMETVQQEASPPESVAEDPEKEKEKVVEVEKEVKVPVSVAASTNEPPAWFKNYVQNVKSEESKIRKEKKPKKVVRQEAKAAAQEIWDDGLTRDRVIQEVDNHLTKMYAQIFGARRLR